MSEASLDLLRRYLPLLDSEYRRIGIAEEMERYFTGSGGDTVSVESCERELEALRAIPSGIGFGAYCARVGMDANAIRQAAEPAPPSDAT